jgi:hypothetical protein
MGADGTVVGDKDSQNQSKVDPGLKEEYEAAFVSREKIVRTPPVEAKRNYNIEKKKSKK